MKWERLQLIEHTRGEALKLDPVGAEALDLENDRRPAPVRDHDDGPATGAREGVGAERGLLLELHTPSGVRLSPCRVDVCGSGRWGDEREGDRAGTIGAIERAARAGSGRSVLLRPRLSRTAEQAVD